MTNVKCYHFNPFVYKSVTFVYKSGSCYPCGYAFFTFGYRPADVEIGIIELPVGRLYSQNIQKLASK